MRRGRPRYTTGRDQAGIARVLDRFRRRGQPVGMPEFSGPPPSLPPNFRPRPKPRLPGYGGYGRRGRRMENGGQPTNEETQAIFEEEVNRNSPGGGLMTLFRGAGDFALGSDFIEEDLPLGMEFAEVFLKSLGATGGGEGILGLDLSEMAGTLADTPGLEEMLSPEMLVVAGMAGPGGKAKSVKQILDELKKLVKEDAPRSISRTETDDVPDFMKSKTRQDRERKQGLDPVEMAKRLEEKNRGRGTASREVLRPPERYYNLKGQLEQEDISAQEVKRINDELAALRKRFPNARMASGGRPGLYANIHAKRKRIEAGSGERMRSPGEKGAPTKAQFRRAATTAKKAGGGGLGYSKGYYGKRFL